jgi:hypothetical protein
LNEESATRSKYASVMLRTVRAIKVRSTGADLSWVLYPDGPTPMQIAPAGGAELSFAANCLACIKQEFLAINPIFHEKVIFMGTFQDDSNQKQHAFYSFLILVKLFRIFRIRLNEVCLSLFEKLEASLCNH